MSDSGAQPIYSVDTSALMDWRARHYPTEIFPSLADRIEGLIDSGRFIAPAMVKEEIGAVGTGDLIDWGENHNDVFVPNAEMLRDALAIQNPFAGLSDPKAEYEEADAYVIALARIRDGIVVSQETSAAEKHKPKRTHFIPDVCRELGLPCINLLGLMRREAWKF